MRMLLLTCIALVAATPQARAAEISARGLILDLVVFGSTHTYGSLGSLKVEGGPRCNDSLEYAIPMETSGDTALFSLLMAAKFAKKPVQLALRDDLIRGRRCTVVGARLLDAP